MISKLISKIKAKNAPIVVGLDPQMSFIPQSIQARAYKEHGQTLMGAAAAIWEFNQKLIDSIYDVVPAIKPQIAMYEQFGVPGLQVFLDTVAYGKQKGLIVIGDIKRGDIGSTSESYAIAHLGRAAVGDALLPVFDEDFATVNPYLGIDGIKPFIDVCNHQDKGIFVLVKTSNQSSGQLQDRILDDGLTLYETVGRLVDEWGENAMDGDYSNIGAVVGATYPRIGAILREMMPKAYMLVPGYGAQGAAAADLAPFFNKDGLGVIVNSSRGIIAAHKSKGYEKFGEEFFADAAREAAKRMAAEIAQVM